MRLLRFGDDPTYDLASLIHSKYRDNFGDVEPVTSRMLNPSDGAYDELGSGRAPAAVGLVELEVTLLAEDDDAMDALRQGIRAMRWWGVQKLYRSVDDDNYEQWCYALAEDIPTVESEREYTYVRQRVPLKFRVYDPAWQREGNVVSDVWSNSPEAGDVWTNAPAVSDVWEAAAVYSVSGTSTEITVTNPGSLPCWCELQLTALANVENPIFERSAAGIVVDRLAYSGTLASSEVMSISTNPLANSITVDGSDAYANLIPLRTRWMELQPGDNTLRVLADNAGASASLTVDFKARWA